MSKAIHWVGPAADTITRLVARTVKAMENQRIVERVSSKELLYDVEDRVPRIACVRVGGNEIKVRCRPLSKSQERVYFIVT